MAKNRNIDTSVALLNAGALTEDALRGLLQQVQYDAWKDAHDDYCDFGSDCTQHPNPHAVDG